MTILFGLYKDGDFKKAYNSRTKADLARLMAQDIRPEHKWEVRPIKREPTL